MNKQPINPSGMPSYNQSQKPSSGWGFPWSPKKSQPKQKTMFNVGEQSPPRTSANRTIYGAPQGGLGGGSFY